MSQFIFLAVLAAAFLDAMMHLMLKAERDSHGMSILTGILCGALGLVAMAFTGLPDAAAWPWLLLSVLWGAAYWLMLGRAYHSGALGLVFPVARGSAVLLSTVVAAALLNETLSGGEILTVLVILCGLATVAYTALPQKFSLGTLGGRPLPIAPRFMRAMRWSCACSSPAPAHPACAPLASRPCRAACCSHRCRP